MKEDTREYIRLLAYASTMGISVVLATIIGFFIGYYLLDQWLGTKPLFTIIFLLVGIVAGFRNMYVIGMKLKNKDKK
ncbi:MAG: AtpZ/AtpI family protein [Deltaproteobacteria bacterium]|nr:AtpZ/AtpI family protein [Deltaproteobacteria bacterium]